MVGIFIFFFFCDTVTRTRTIFPMQRCRKSRGRRQSVIVMRTLWKIISNFDLYCVRPQNNSWRWRKATYVVYVYVYVHQSV